MLTLSQAICLKFLLSFSLLFRLSFLCIYNLLNFFSSLQRLNFINSNKTDKIKINGILWRNDKRKKREKRKKIDEEEYSSSRFIHLTGLSRILTRSFQLNARARACVYVCLCYFILYYRYFFYTFCIPLPFYFSKYQFVSSISKLNSIFESHQIG